MSRQVAHGVLLIEPDAARRAAVGAALEEAGLRVSAHPVIPDSLPDDAQAVVLAHDVFSSQAVARFHARDSLLPVLVITPRRPDTAAALELGRAHVQDVVEVRSAADAAGVAERVTAAIERRASRMRPRRIAEQIVGVSDAIQQARRYIEVAAGSDASVLIIGESGTGKELVARAIHSHGARAGGPLVAVNCSAIPESLLESEFFGHEKGSFTGAVGRARGVFEQADSGTLFFDEIGEMPLMLQSKLLRVLQPPPGTPPTTREFVRVGGEQPVRTDVRMLFATNRELSAEVEAGRFREDLYQRIAVLTIGLPPLRERPDDIALLARLFLEQCAAMEGRPGMWIDPVALDVLCAYGWPRNVRELESVMRSLVLLKEQGGAVVLGDLPPRLFGEASSSASGEGDVAGEDAPLRTLAEVERAHVERVLGHCGGNKSRASRILGVSRQALDRKLASWLPGGAPEVIE